MQVNRRALLKLGAAGALTSPAAQSEPLPCPPRPADLASDRLVHRLYDLFNPPAVQNEWGYAQAAKSVAGITGISIPPFACCGLPRVPAAVYMVTCELYLDGRLLSSYPGTAGEVAYTWYPHRVVREARHQELSFLTETFMPSCQRAVAQKIVVKNESRQERSVRLGFNLRGGVTVLRGKPWIVNSPAEADNRITPGGERGCLVFEARNSPAVSAQGLRPVPDRIEHGHVLVYDLLLNAGEARGFHYLNVIGEDASAMLRAYEQGQAGFERLLQESEQAFATLLQAAFTPGNSEFSGCLPRLETRDRALWRLYYTGFTNLLFGRRVSPDSVYGPTYLTLSPRVLPTLSFLWDISLTSFSLALLDPAVLRKLMEVWFERDVHKMWATDYLTGEANGPWYAVNDMAVLRCAHNYLRVTGDFGWLDKSIAGRSVMDRLIDHALYWKQLDRRGRGLADYGNMVNLLEVVSTYSHEVAGMNAGNVYGMRFVAEVLERRGEPARAAQMRAEATALARRINERLYVEGKGWWRCLQPDGGSIEVRHCYDLLTVFDTMFEDLSERQRREMSRFFWSELHTAAWMHALSPADADATWNLRADHSWLGAFGAWPALTAKGFYKIDPSARVAEWVKGLARSANQGPFGQAHLAETLFPDERGGARKCPQEKPWDNDWSILAGGCFTDLVIESIFGAELTLFDGIRVTSRLRDFDPAASLRDLSYQGKLYTIVREGVQNL